MRGYFRKTSRTVLPLLLLACVAASFSFSQLPTATILGTVNVKDSNGAVVPDTTSNLANAAWTAFSVAGKRTETNRFLMNGADYIGDNNSGQRFGDGAHGVMDKLIGGWQWNGIVNAQSGFLSTLRIGSNDSGTGDTVNPDVPNRNPAFTGPEVLGTDGFRRTGRYYDPRTFSMPIGGTFGNVSRGGFLGPGLTTFDTSLFKKSGINEKWNMQFRAEAFNIFNHANFGEPNAAVFTGNNISGSAGVITGTATASLQMQFALRLRF
jgi:hypothetical protein